MEKITSTNNPKIKATAKLFESKERIKTGLFLIEGIRELELAIKHNLKITQLFYCPELCKETLPEISNTIEITKAVFEKLTYRGTSGGLLAVAEIPKLTLKDLTLKTNSQIVVLENMEKPGNIGAILRTANAAGVAAVLVCDEASELYNPNVIRASLGALFVTPTIAVDSKSTINWLKQNKIKIVATTPHTKTVYSDSNLKGSVAIVIGSEKDGLSKIWLDNADEKVLIPMSGEVDSLNASVSAGILIYEALRQSTSK